MRFLLLYPPEKNGPRDALTRRALVMCPLSRVRQSRTRAGEEEPMVTGGVMAKFDRDSTAGSWLTWGGRRGGSTTGRETASRSVGVSP